MRKNHPITQHEFALVEGETLVSATDLKGRITYCNPAFVRVSGYLREELIGQPHNLIRHPDMPAEAFRDLWATVQAGRPWSAIVKNRRKDGGHYWVQANVTPVLEAGRVVGYLSVRTRPGRAQVDAAAALYQRMQKEARDGTLVTLLREGRLGRPERAAIDAAPVTGRACAGEQLAGPRGGGPGRLVGRWHERLARRLRARGGGGPGPVAGLALAAGAGAAHSWLDHAGAPHGGR